MGALILVRHGQASFGTENYDRLSPLGHQQAEWLGEYFAAHGLRFERAIRGALRRHRETAEGIARVLRLPEFAIDPRLDEFQSRALVEEYALATGAAPPSGREGFLQHFPEVLARWEAGVIGSEAPERYQSFQARVDAAIADAYQPGHNTLVVTSGGVIGVTLRRVLGLDITATAELMLAIHNASVHRLDWEGGKLRLTLFNASPHLDPVERIHARTFI
ncbi:MAG: histidine phosphatase family protein [Alphaproteobacteria bacterium]|nr:MAG: histidine phosphatase family protein [Alphaproteobacteria bacterium]